MKVYIYCTKSKPYIGINGKVVACFDLNKITMIRNRAIGIYMDGSSAQKLYEHPGKDIIQKTGMTFKEIAEYGNNKNLYCWHIENLEAFDEPFIYFGKAPQSWCYAEFKDERCIIISIKPEWVEKILSGEKTIEIRKTAPKELMIK